jgi:DNA-binding GntR family transcriptional regulator
MTIDTVAQNAGILHNTILRDEVYDYLRKNILNHHFPPGHRFDLKELEKQLGISRTPLKVALHRLESEGLTKIRPRSGTFVTPLDINNVAESFDVRIMLETAAAPIVIANATDHEIAHLGVINKQLRTLLESGDYQEIVEQYIELDQEMHMQYMSYARNKQLMRIYSRLNIHLQIARVRRRFTRPSSDETQQEHEAILMAISARNVAGLQATLTEHLTKSKERTLSALRNHE